MQIARFEGQQPLVLVVTTSQPEGTALAALGRREGWVVELASNRSGALELARERELSLVLVDVDVGPTADSLEVLRALRGVEQRRYLPIVVLIGDKDARAVELSALGLGADEVLQKPWDSELLLARARRLLALRHRFDELALEADRLRTLATTDALTKLANSRGFEERLSDEFRRAQRYDDPVAVMQLDLDQFKKLNQRHGFAAGDQVLVSVAASLEASVRETDFLARCGGEEFAVVLPQTHLGGAITVAERVWRDLGTLRLGPEGEDRITASIGLAAYPGRAILGPEQLQAAANDALAQSKRQGGNRIVLYEHSTPDAPRGGSLET